MLNQIFKSVSTGETVEVVEFDDKSKQCIVKLKDGKTKAYSLATLKDKRRFTPVDTKKEELKVAAYEAKTDYVAEVMQQKKDLKKSTGTGKSRIMITYRGSTKTPFEWGRLLGLDPKYIRAQLRKGKSPEEIFKEKK